MAIFNPYPKRGKRASQPTTLPIDACWSDVAEELAHRTKAKQIDAKTAYIVHSLLSKAVTFKDGDDAALRRYDALLDAAIVMLDGKKARLATFELV